MLANCFLNNFQVFGIIRLHKSSLLAQSNLTVNAMLFFDIPIKRIRLVFDTTVLSIVLVFEHPLNLLLQNDTVEKLSQHAFQHTITWGIRTDLVKLCFLFQQRLLSLNMYLITFNCKEIFINVMFRSIFRSLYTKENIQFLIIKCKCIESYFSEWHH